MPIQPSGARGVRGTLELDPSYEEGLADIAGFSHLVLLYHFHAAGEAKLTVTPYLDTASHGVFATRAPARPNPIGLSIVRLLGLHGAVLELEDVDILDGTPVLDVKPYVPAFDAPAGEVRTGWLAETESGADTARADERFHEKPSAPEDA
jgi:tRNA-Thr(GGU) m(6)t(6)A37 methyltransferase TsaA